MVAGPPGRINFVKPVPASVQFLDKQLQSPDPLIRKQGVESIPKLGAPHEPLTECIAKLFEHQNWYVRQAAAEAAVKCIESKGAAHIIVEQVAGKRMAHEDAEVRRCADRALVGIVKVATTPPDEMEGVPDFATGKLHKKEAPKIPEHIEDSAADQAAKQLKNPETLIRKQAVVTLAKMGANAKPYAKNLGALVGDPDLSVRNATVRVLSSLGVIVVDAIDVVTNMLTHDDDAVSRTAMRAVLVLASHSGELTAASTAKHLSHPSPVVRRRVASCMVEFGSLSAPHGPALTEFLDDPSVDIRFVGVRALIAAGPDVAKSSLKLIRKRLLHESPDVRRAAVDTIRGLAPQSEQVANIIGKILIEEEEDGTEESVRERLQVLEILGGAGANAAPFLVEMAKELESSDWRIRRASIESLADLGPHAKDAAREVSRRMLHHEPDVRRAAVEALGRMGKHAGQHGSRIEGMAETEEDPDVKRTCLAALKMMQKTMQEQDQSED